MIEPGGAFSAYRDAVELSVLGRLNRGEFDERNAKLTGSRTLGEIPPLVHDLVAKTPARMSPADVRIEAERRYRADRRDSLTYAQPGDHLPGHLGRGLISVHGNPFPWPLFVTFATAMPAVRPWLNPEGAIRLRMRRIEKRQTRRSQSN